jgi:hypothetical protein
LCPQELTGEEAETDGNYTDIHGRRPFMQLRELYAELRPRGTPAIYSGLDEDISGTETSGKIARIHTSVKYE